MIKRHSNGRYVLYKKIGKKYHKVAYELDLYGGEARDFTKNT